MENVANFGDVACGCGMVDCRVAIYCSGAS